MQTVTSRRKKLLDGAQGGQSKQRLRMKEDDFPSQLIPTWGGESYGLVLADESNNPCLFSSAYCMKLNTILSNVCMAAAGADMHRASSDFEISKPNIVSC
jgi:hypothetical protein